MSIKKLIAPNLTPATKLAATIIVLFICGGSSLAFAVEDIVLPGKYLDYSSASNAVASMPKDRSYGGGICCGHHEPGYKKAYRSVKYNGQAISYYASFYYPERTTCPSGTVKYSDNSCRPKPTDPPPQACAGNPIGIANGMKHQTEIDYLDNLSGILTFTRSYSSSTGAWKHSLSSLVSAYSAEGKLPFSAWVWSTDHQGNQSLYLARGNSEDGVTYVSNTPVSEGLSVDSGSVVNIDGEGGIRRQYNANGELIRAEQLSSGNYVTYTYNENEIIAKDNHNRTLRIGIDSDGTLRSLTTPDNSTYTYTYAGDNLVVAAHSNGSSRTYHYEDERFPHALTGITDEKGVRYASWTYDDQGRAVTSEHAVGIEKAILVFNGDGSTTVTNELGKQTVYHFQSVYGLDKPTFVEGSASTNCLAANSSYTYDSNGYKDLVTDWKGNVTDYDHNDRGLETRRIEAKGTPEERIIETEWHADFHLPIKITEPDRVTEFSYDDNGRLRSKSIKPVTIN
ncbi:hypothetical protein BTA51_02175 [Hahella sp. CCB-MM4]|uniref:RHS repeat protein n=1 Tax=Hahella sp. (strain CCB-MM4) TaxID=1926491 RepID=UPI000B9B1944|nr:RHS repeat protein [Hahella sp. CCB-MM4]OZG75213.1 hypothetical protein BTA51_02175 [Hahella sp. CCB-MM4]